MGRLLERARRSGRQYAKTMTMAATGQVGDSALFLVNYLLRLLRVVLLLTLWQMVLRGRGPVSGMTLGAVLTYTVIAEVFAEQLEPRTRIEDGLWEGTLAARFLQPMDLVGQLTADMVGRWLFTFVTFSLPLLLIAPLLGVNPLPANAIAGGLFVLSLLLGITVGLALDFFFGALTAALEQNVWQVSYIRRSLMLILSGTLLPLALLPWSLGAAFAWLPFASVASAPLRIYTGTGDALPQLALQVLWALVLWPLAWWLWNASREKLAFHGG